LVRQGFEASAIVIDYAAFSLLGFGITVLP
jgi:hypothetical protein